MSIRVARSSPGWADRPEGTHYDLVDGQVVGMAPERAARVGGKQRVFRKLEDAIAAAGLACEGFARGLAVRVNDATVCEPDVLVRRGPPLPGDTPRVTDPMATDPMIVVELLSPSSRWRDAGRKLADYFRVASLRHHLLVATATRTIIRHSRDEAGTIITHIVRDGRLVLEPPGPVLDELVPPDEIFPANGPR